MDAAARTQIAEKVLHADTLDHEITPLYTDPSLRWRRTVVLPFGGAYRTAFDNYDKVMKEQAKHYEDMRKLAFELTMSVLAIGGGSILTAVFADATLKVAAKEMALDYVCKRNMDKTFTLMHRVESSPVLSFMAGQAWDGAQTKALDTIKKKIEPRTGSYKSLADSVKKPHEVLENLEKFNLELRERGIDFIKFVRGLKLPHKAKVEIVKGALTSDYLKPPSRELDKEHLIPRLELTLFMQMLTRADKLRQRGFKALGPNMMEVKTTYTDIRHSARSNRYPKKQPHRPFMPNPDIVMPGVGSIIMDHVDKLYKRLYGKAFFSWGEHWDWEFTNGEVKSIVKRAEAALEMLSKDSHLGMLARAA
ncbi:MAG: hypothetical protein GVY13_05780 [Alphaproteobacteria bacterium]|jgi:hypothetical protein|nr:hypothetical protein [Alphaproteobacteria bacterium]